MNSVTINCAAKINIGLDVLNRRPDGYHDIKTLMQSVSLFDTLVCEKNSGIVIECDDKRIRTDESNIIWKCIAAAQRTFGVTAGMRVRLTKRIPYCAGLGGGSADGAAAFMAMATLYGFRADLEKLCLMAKNIGADIPYMFYGGLCLCEGIGEIITPVSASPGCDVLIVKPGLCISTKDAYDAIDGCPTLPNTDFVTAAEALKTNSFNKLKQSASNTFECCAADRYPEIAKIKNALYALGADFAMMSGSGSAVYGLFGDKQAAQHAHEKMDRRLGTILTASFTEKALYIL